MDRVDLVLYFIGCDARAVDPIRIMKGIFLFTQRMIGRESPYGVLVPFDFQPMQYGPCAPEVYCVLDSLAAAGQVERIPVPGETWVKYRVTERGLRRITDIVASTNAELLESVRELRGWCQDRSFTQLLRAVYSEYPDFAVNSVLPHLGRVR